MGPNGLLLVATGDSDLVSSLTRTEYEVQPPTEAESIAVLAGAPMRRPRCSRRSRRRPRPGCSRRWTRRRNLDSRASAGSAGRPTTPCILTSARRGYAASSGFSRGNARRGSDWERCIGTTGTVKPRIRSGWRRFARRAPSQPPPNGWRTSASTRARPRPTPRRNAAGGSRETAAVENRCPSFLLPQISGTHLLK